MKKLSLYALLFFPLVFTGCSYKFANQLYRPPAGASTIYIEAAFDTSAKALNHQIITRAFEKVVARDGKLALTRRLNADLYLRIQMLDATRTQVDRKPTELTENDENPSPDLGSPAPNLKDFESLTAPQYYAKRETMNLRISVEVWDLKTKKRTFSESFSAAGTYAVLDAIKGQAIKESKYLRYDEVVNERLELLGEDIAKRALLSFYKKQGA